MEPTTTTKRVVRLPGVQTKVALRRDAVYRLIRLGKFPRPIKLTGRASGWIEEEIDAWIAERAAARDAE